MIVLNVTYKCNPGTRNAFLEAILDRGIRDASRAEAGNIMYDYYIPVSESDELLLIEKWSGPEALKEHGRQPHFAGLGEIKREYVTDTVIERFDVQE